MHLSAEEAPWGGCLHRTLGLSSHLRRCSHAKSKIVRQAHWAGLQPASCRGGHGTEPYEQRTQQPPWRGCSSSPHSGQFQNHTHAWVGMTFVDW